MAVNPLYYGATTLVDLTQDTVTAETLAEGVTAHDKNGKPLVGTMATSSAPKTEQTKTATPSLSQQTISPDSGKVLSGVTVEPITSALLTALDSDFKTENIAEGVNMFGVTGTFAGGIKMAEGTVSKARDSITVSGLGFAPNNVFIIAQGASASNMVYCSFNTSAIISGFSNIRTITLTFTEDGFTVIPVDTNKKYYGNYDWVAWKE